MRFDSYHPGINFLYFTAVIAGTVIFQHPVYLAISFLSAWAYTTKLNKLPGALFGIFAAVAGAAFGLWYASYHHFGITVLRTNFIGNNMTVESLVCGEAHFKKLQATIL